MCVTPAFSGDRSESVTEDGPDQDLSARVERLEREIKVLREALGQRSDGTAEAPSQAGMDAQAQQRERAQARRRLDALRAAQSGEAEHPGGDAPRNDTSLPQGPGFGPAAATQAAPPSARLSSRDILESAELWLPRVGIGLVLLAVAFAFKYSIDQGWVIPAVRVALGYGLGLALLGLGFKLVANRGGDVTPLGGQAVRGGPGQPGAYLADPAVHGGRRRLPRVGLRISQPKKAERGG